MELGFFLFIAVGAVISGLLVLMFRDPVNCALALLAQFLCLAVVYALLHALLIAMVQLLVYAGAIIVLFLFAIMLINPEKEKGWLASLTLGRVLVIAFGSLIVLASLFLIILQTPLAQGISAHALLDNAKAVGRLLFVDYLFPFEIISVLLLVAIIGVVVLASREPEDPAGQGGSR